jgi:hypothetical protein
MEKLEALIAELERNIANMNVENQAVSKSPVGWHIDHALLTINKITSAIKSSDPKEYKWKFSFSKVLVFALNKIPRGRAKAPKSVQPEVPFTKESLSTHLSKIREKVKVLNTLPPNSHFDHPYFGKLNLKPSIKFLSLHTKHHLDIIHDILKSVDQKSSNRP